MAGLVGGGRRRLEDFDGMLQKTSCKKVILTDVAWHVQVDGWAVIFHILY